MNVDLLPELRARVGGLMAQPADGLDAESLFTMVRNGIAAERAKRQETKGAGSTLTLNGLLDVEMQIHTKVFKLPRPEIKPF